MADDNPSAKSDAYQLMETAWLMIDAILGGAEQIRLGSVSYLPKYTEETDSEFRLRLESTPWRPEFVDALRTLASKPFSQDVGIDRKGPKNSTDNGPQVSEQIKEFAEDVDQRGNNITVFAREMFNYGIAMGLHGLLVEWPKSETGETLADENRSGARPYWVHVRAKDIIALYTTMRGGMEVISHVRIRESTTERSGQFGETTINRIRVLELNELNKPTWQIWREAETVTAGINSPSSYVLEDSGEYRNVDDIPLVLYWTGERIGQHYVRPPLIDLAYMQIELYRALSRKEEIMTFAGSPMLKVTGLRERTSAEAPRHWAVGPRTVIDLPTSVDGVSPDADYIQPSAANIAEVRNDVQAITDDMRRLGMQPMTQRVGGVTATATGVESAKAHSVVQWWAMSLKDALEQGFAITTRWLKQPDEIEVRINTDFSVEPYADAPLQAIDKARARKDLSLRTYWECLKRYDVLPPDFDPEDEDEAMAEEMLGLQPEQTIDPVTGKPV